MKKKKRKNLESVYEYPLDLCNKFQFRPVVEHREMSPLAVTLAPG